MECIPYYRVPYSVHELTKFLVLLKLHVTTQISWTIKSNTMRTLIITKSLGPEKLLCYNKIFIHQCSCMYIKMDITSALQISKLQPEWPLTFDLGPHLLFFPDGALLGLDIHQVLVGREELAQQEDVDLVGPEVEPPRLLVHLLLHLLN